MWQWWGESSQQQKYLQKIPDYRRQIIFANSKYVYAITRQDDRQHDREEVIHITKVTNRISWIEIKKQFKSYQRWKRQKMITIRVIHISRTCAKSVIDKDYESFEYITRYLYLAAAFNSDWSFGGLWFVK